LPFSFGNGSTANNIDAVIGFRDDNGNNGAILELGSGGRYGFPSFNVDFPINTMIYQPATVDSKWGFEVLTSSGRVSQLNVPASLNAVTIKARVYLNVRHTFTMLV